MSGTAIIYLRLFIEHGFLGGKWSYRNFTLGAMFSSSHILHIKTLPFSARAPSHHPIEYLFIKLLISPQFFGRARNFFIKRYPLILWSSLHRYPFACPIIILIYCILSCFLSTTWIYRIIHFLFNRSTFNLLMWLFYYRNNLCKILACNRLIFKSAKEL